MQAGRVVPPTVPDNVTYIRGARDAHKAARIGPFLRSSHYDPMLEELVHITG